MSKTKIERAIKRTIIAKAERCIYCEATTNLTIEHMPPISLFKHRKRPNGLMFAACKSCNNGSKGADAVANVFSRMTPLDDADFWQTKHGKSAFATMDRDAPRVRPDVLQNHTAERIWVRDEKTGILRRTINFQPDSSILKAYLDVFSAKLGMALFREHIGFPLPLDGGVQTYWFLNAQLNERQVKSALSFMPTQEKLKQGTFTSDNQFVYRYNCDNKDTFMSLVLLNYGLIVLVFASSEESFFDDLVAIEGYEGNSNFMQPGQLLEAIS